MNRIATLITRSIWRSLWGFLLRLQTKRLRPFLLTGLAALIITEIVALSPVSVEEGGTLNVVPVDPETLIHEDSVSLAPGIPVGRVPEYSIEGFNYVSSQGTEKQWNVIADHAVMFNAEKLVHARKVTAYLFDPDGTATVVTGKEAKYFTNKRDLEVYGDVHTVFPDGFETNSQYLRYLPNIHKVEIPPAYPVSGHSDPNKKDEQLMEFQSRGMDFAMADSQIILPQSVRVTMTQTQVDVGKTADRTVIESDHCVIFRERQMAHFTMNPERPLKTRFVHILQPTLFARSRRADLNYGDFTKVLQYMTAYEDVLIRDTGSEDTLQYSTSGRADFDTHRDVIVLTDFPQVYQDDDTVTGDVILMHRDSDIVEVEHSNAFTNGN